MAEPWEDNGAWGSASRVPTNEWFPVNTSTGAWQLPGQPATLASSAGVPDVTAPPVWGGTPDQAPLAIGQVAGTLAPPMTRPASMARVARADQSGLLPEQPSIWQTLARSIGMASPTGQAILKGFDQQQQQGLTNRLALRRQQLLEEQETRQATSDDYNTLVKIAQNKSKSLRNALFDRWTAEKQAAGTPVAQDMVDAFKKSGLDEGVQIATMFEPIIKASGLDMNAARQYLQEGGDIKGLVDMIDIRTKQQKLLDDQAEEARITQQRAQYGGGTLGQVSGTQAHAPTTPPTTASPPPTTPVATAPPGTVPPVLDTAVTDATKLYPQVRPDLVHGIIRHESNYDVGAVSPKGAMGPMQLMPATAKEQGVDPTDAAQNVRGGVRYYAQLLTKYQGNEALALAAYNWGPGNVEKVNGDLTKMPAETQAYVKNVLASAAPGGQRGPADTRQQVASAGAPAVPAADQAQLQALNNRITLADTLINQNMGSGRERTKGWVNELQQERTRLIQERDKLTEPQRAVQKERELGGVRLGQKEAETRMEQPYQLERVREARALTPISDTAQQTLATNKSVYRSIGKIEQYFREGTTLPEDFVNLVAQDAPGIRAQLAADPKNATGILEQWETKLKAASNNDPDANRFLSALGNMRDLIIRERSGGSVTGNELNRAMGAFMGSLPNINQAFSLFVQNLANVKETVVDSLVTAGAASRPLAGGKAMYGSLPKEVRDRIDAYERGEEPPKAQMPGATTTATKPPNAPGGRPVGPVRRGPDIP